MVVSVTSGPCPRTPRSPQAPSAFSRAPDPPPRAPARARAAGWTAPSRPPSSSPRWSLAVLAPADRRALVGRARRSSSPTLAARIEFSIGAGYAVPTQLVLVPMLLLLPTPLVPLLVGAAPWSARRPGTRSAASRPAASLFAPADALVRARARRGARRIGAQTPGWDHWPPTWLALAAQLVRRERRSIARAAWHVRPAPAEVSRELRARPARRRAARADRPARRARRRRRAARRCWSLTLIPLLAASRASATARIEHSLELGRAYRGTALLLRDLLEEDDEYTGHHTEDVVELTVASPRRWASTRTRCARPRWARCCTTSARSPCPTRSSTSPARSTTRSGRS